jgi:DNA-binding response OmpR family regulator
MGFTVDEAGDVEAALEAVSRSPFDLVLLDLVLPHRGAREVGRSPMEGTLPGGRVALVAMRARAPEVPVVVTSGWGADHEDVVACANEGASAFLPKPLRYDALRTTLEELGLPSR